jgi:hypothetical protein
VRLVAACNRTRLASRSVDMQPAVCFHEHTQQCSTVMLRCFPPHQNMVQQQRLTKLPLHHRDVAERQSAMQPKQKCSRLFSLKVNNRVGCPSEEWPRGGCIARESFTSTYTQEPAGHSDTLRTTFQVHSVKVLCTFRLLLRAFLAPRAMPGALQSNSLREVNTEAKAIRRSCIVFNRPTYPITRHGMTVPPRARPVSLLHTQS